MRSIILLVFLVGLFTTAVADYECSRESYLSYRQHYNKTEELPEDLFTQKFEKFCDSIRYVVQSNALNQGTTFTINQFSDLLDNQRGIMLNIKKPVGGKSSKVQLSKVSSYFRVQASPPNWRAQNKVSKIKDQGQCGACWAFTSTGLYQSYLMYKGQGQYDLSEQFLLQCTSLLVPNGYTSDCTGGYTDFALQLPKKYGIPEDSKWPYKGGPYGTRAGTPTSPGICQTNQTFIKYENMPGVKNTTNLTRYDNATVAEIQTLLADGPLGALMMVDANFQAYSVGVYTQCPDFYTSFSTINHAVVIVGMDANKNYIIKNSWSTAWGDSGFATVSSTNDCALSAFVFQYTWGYQLLTSSFLFLITTMFVML